MGFINDNLFGHDVIPEPGISGHYFDRLVKSYALDSMYLDPPAMSDNDHRAKVEELFSFLENSKEEKFPSPGLGDSIQIEGEGITGSGVLYGQEMIHLALFSLNQRHKR